MDVFICIKNKDRIEGKTGKINLSEGEKKKQKTVSKGENKDKNKNSAEANTVLRK